MTTDGHPKPEGQPDRALAPPFRVPVPSVRHKPRELRPFAVSVAMIVIAAIAFGASVYLAGVAQSGGSAAGCDAANLGACDEVLSSRWSKWFAFPVSMLAVAAYGSILAAIGFTFVRSSPQVARAAWLVLLVLAPMALGAGLWFTSLQLFELESICKYCMTVHGCGLLLVVLVWIGGPIRWRQGAGPANTQTARFSLTQVAAFAFLGFLGTSVLIAGQVFYESRPPMYRVDRAAPANNTIASNVTARAAPEYESSDSTTVVAIEDKNNRAKQSTSPPSKSRLLTLYKSAEMIDVYQHPMIGSPAAKHVLVKLFDYTCHHCRTLHFQLETIRSRSKGQLAIVVLPVPLNNACNQYAGPAQGTRHEHACTYARLAIAVWRIDRTKFEDFHCWLFETKRPRSTRLARKYAMELVGKRALEKQLQNFRLSIQIGQYTKIYGRSGRGTIPKLINDKMIIDGRFHDVAELSEVLRKEIGLDIEE